MRGAFSERFKQKIEESPILKKALLRIFALTICTGLLFYVAVNTITNSDSFTLKNFFIEALVPAVMGAICSLGVFSNIIHHIKEIIEELMQESPDWVRLENEYMESDIKSLYLAIRRLHSSLSDQKNLEEAHEETRRVLAELNTRMDEERRLIARQLHDDINPTLILSKLELQKLIPLINKNIHDMHQAKAARSIVDKLTDFISNVYQESREIIKSTRIELIDSIGLTAAIESLVSHYQNVLEKPSIHFAHNLPKRPDVPSKTAINTYRIIQEALLNIIKHANASQVTIAVQYDKETLDVSITDNGIGIKAKNNQGIGLIDMRERARTLGTVLRILNQPEGGTKISFFAVLSK